jgi:hypothetical protein
VTRSRRKRVTYEERLRGSSRDVDQWFHELALRSRLTARQHVRTLGRLCEVLGLSPPELVSIARKRDSSLKSKLVEYATALKARNVQESYIVRTFAVLRSWLKHNRVRFDRDDLFPKLVSTSTVRQERIPTPDELRQVLAHLTSRGRVCALLMAHSGLRPGAVGHYDGTDGLTLADLPELDLESFEFQRIPFLISVPSRLSKNRAPYSTFGSSESASAILAYLRERRDKFEESMTGSTPLVSVARQVKFGGAGAIEPVRYQPKFVTELNIAYDLRTALRRVFPHDTPRPYCLRSYFSSQMFAAEGQHRISATYREAMMGHTSGIDAVYNVRKGNHLVEDLRSAYAAAEEFLTTQQSSARDIEAKRVLDRMATLLGLDRDQLVDRLSTVVGEAKAAEPGANDGNASKAARKADQVVRPMSQLKTLVERGYKFVAQVGPEGVFDVPAG